MTAPALSPEEWERAFTQGGSQWWTYGFGGEEEGHMTRHRMAALCLWGQPEGFTREDVDLVRAASDEVEWKAASRLLSLAERISALLPPGAK